MEYTPEQKGKLDAIYDKLKGQRTCMLATIDVPTGRMHSRPMAIQETERDGTLWFFTSRSSEKATELKQDGHVNISIADEGKDLYMSISGRGQIVNDQAKIEELWSPVLKAWFPDGKESPELSLLKVTIQEAEYWDVKASKMVQLFHMAKAALTGATAEDMSEHKKVVVEK